MTWWHWWTPCDTRHHDHQGEGLSLGWGCVLLWVGRLRSPTESAESKAVRTNVVDSGGNGPTYLCFLLTDFLKAFGKEAKRWERIECYTAPVPSTCALFWVSVPWRLNNKPFIHSTCKTNRSRALGSTSTHDCQPDGNTDDWDPNISSYTPFPEFNS